MASYLGSLNRFAFSATAHCLTGCAIGEVLGVIIGTGLGWSDAATIALALVLALFFGYLVTSLPLVRSGMALAAVVPIAGAVAYPATGGCSHAGRATRSSTTITERGRPRAAP